MSRHATNDSCFRFDFPLTPSPIARSQFASPVATDASPTRRSETTAAGPCHAKPCYESSGKVFRRNVVDPAAQREMRHNRFTQVLQLQSWFGILLRLLDQIIRHVMMNIEQWMADHNVDSHSGLAFSSVVGDEKCSRRSMSRSNCRR